MTNLFDNWQWAILGGLAEDIYAVEAKLAGAVAELASLRAEVQRFREVFAAGEIPQVYQRQLGHLAELHGTVSSHGERVTDDLSSLLAELHGYRLAAFGPGPT